MTAPTTYTAPGIAEPLTLDRLTILGGYRNRATVYDRVRKGLPIAGKTWTAVSPAKNPLASCWADGISRNMGNQPSSPTPGTRHKGNRQNKRIVCTCPLCLGREWDIDAIRALPNFPGAVVNGYALPKISACTGHAFSYAVGASAGRWRKNGAIVRMPEPESRTPHRYGTDPAALEVLPINPMRLTAADGPEGGSR